MRRLLLLILLVPLAAQAESVTIKGAGDVNLSAFDCIPITGSKLLHRVCYKEAQHYLVAQVGSDYYDSCNVSSKVVDGLIDSDHVVAYYNQHLRAGHKCTAEVRQRIGIATLGESEQSAQ